MSKWFIGMLAQYTGLLTCQVHAVLAENCFYLPRGNMGMAATRQARKLKSNVNKTTMYGRT